MGSIFVSPLPVLHFLMSGCFLMHSLSCFKLLALRLSVSRSSSSATFFSSSEPENSTSSSSTSKNLLFCPIFEDSAWNNGLPVSCDIRNLPRDPTGHWDINYVTCRSALYQALFIHKIWHYFHFYLSASWTKINSHNSNLRLTEFFTETTIGCVHCQNHFSSVVVFIY